MAGATTVPPPPGVKDGGVWGKNRYIGSATQAAAFVGCLCFCIPGLIILLCPLDERDAYKVQGKIYTADGVLLGSSDQFIATMPPARQSVIVRE